LKTTTSLPQSLIWFNNLGTDVQHVGYNIKDSFILNKYNL